MRIYSTVSVALALAACSAPAHRPVLGDVDRPMQRVHAASTAAAAAKNRDEIRKAYMDYLQHAAKDDRLRADALYRLAQLEFEQTESQSATSAIVAAAPTAKSPDIAQDRTIELLTMLLRDRPKAADNDKALYQLARAYDRRGSVDQSIEALNRLVKDYPKSPYYVESRFRIAEYTFIHGDYGRAEDFYTEVLLARNNGLFREKALYKRGWTRFKQNYYREAVDDFVKAASLNDFDDVARLSAAKKNDFEEYFRAMGLSFINLGGAEAIDEYFAAHPDFRYLYQAYARTSLVYLAQERYTDAVSVLQAFNRAHPGSVHAPEAALRVVEIWRISGFSNRFVDALDQFYARYQPDAPYWNNRAIDAETRRSVIAAFKDDVVLAAAYLHKEYQASNKEADFAPAKVWYERYLRHFGTSARRDNIQYLYAQLLVQHGDDAEALTHYERAAFDGDLIANKDAAYAAIITVSKLHKTAAGGVATDYRDKLMRYSAAYVQFYRGDQRATEVAAHAAEQAYRDGLYARTIDLVESFANVPLTEATVNLKSVGADAYFKLQRYPEAEAAYQALLQYPAIDTATRGRMQGNLALAIYRQGEAAKAANDFGLAVYHYVRISDVVPKAEVAATGLYDAIVLSYDHKAWADTVKYAERFQKLYSGHRLSRDATLKLSTAYLNTHDEHAAATTLVNLARTDDNAEYKTAALWKAAGLFEAKQDYAAAIKVYEDYAISYPRPYPQYAEAVAKLIALNTTRGDTAHANDWRERVLATDKKTPGGLKTDRTNFVCASAALALGRDEYQQYAAIKLSLPLNRSLSRKKSALQKTLSWYSLASSYGVRETATEAMHSIGDIYYTFSKSLLESERPKGLSAIEQDQYKILLEDQAFPFEDNAIKFYEKNMAYTNQGIFDDWVRNSYRQLRLLFPARYAREPLLEAYVNVLH